MGRARQEQLDAFGREAKILRLLNHRYAWGVVRCSSARLAVARDSARPESLRARGGGWQLPRVACSSFSFTLAPSPCARAASRSLLPGASHGSTAC